MTESKPSPDAFLWADTPTEEVDEKAFRVFHQRRTEHKKHRGREYILHKCQEDWKTMSFDARRVHYMTAYNVESHHLKCAASVAFPHNKTFYLARMTKRLLPSPSSSSSSSSSLAPTPLLSGKKRKREPDPPLVNDPTITATATVTASPHAFSLRHSLERLEQMHQEYCNPQWQVGSTQLPSVINKQLEQALSQGRGFYATYTNKDDTWATLETLPVQNFPSKYMYKNNQRSLHTSKKASWVWMDPVLTGSCMHLLTGERRSLTRCGTTSSTTLTTPQRRLSQPHLFQSTYPDTWSFANEHDKTRVVYRSVPLKSTEACNILMLFHATCPTRDFRVRSIGRIQNSLLWTMHRTYVTECRRRPPPPPPPPPLHHREDGPLSRGEDGHVQILFHGTSYSNAASIAATGFNRSLTGPNGHRLGYGTYFARDAELSAADLYSKPHHNSQSKSKFMLICSVMTGVYVQGHEDMHTAPRLDPDAFASHDTTVDSIDRPTIYSTFSDYQSYPLYMIEFANV